MNTTIDILIVGAGIVGLATATALKGRHPGARIAIVEKESGVAQHQTGHNSGVIHSGIYYKPGSLKAKLCVEGRARMEAFCRAHDIPTQQVGKLIVATDESELERLQTLYERGIANGVPGVRMIDATELRTIEPHAAGIRAVHSPNTGIVDYKQVSRAMHLDLEARGVDICTVSKAVAIRPPKKRGDELCVTLADGRQMAARHLINCAGLQSDEVARMMGLEPDIRIVPFRGEYYFIKPQQRSLVRGLIYPVPDPNFPFLGVHFTRTVYGEVEAGPNAVFAFAREGYHLADIDFNYLFGTLGFGGFRAIARKWWRTGAYEIYRSLSKTAFVASLQKLVPEMQADDVVRGGAGLRAQAISADGQLVDDFRFLESERALHVLNAPSPAATASLAIGDYIAGRAEAIGMLG